MVTRLKADVTTYVPSIMTMLVGTERKGVFEKHPQKQKSIALSKP